MSTHIGTRTTSNATKKRMASLREEGGERPELDEQEAGVVGGGRVAADGAGAVRATRFTPARVDHDRHPERRGQQRERDGDPVDGEVPAQPERRDPRRVDLRAQRNGDQRRAGR